MEVILNNIIGASLRKVEEDVENEEEVVNLLENLANSMKDVERSEIIRRILSMDFLKSLDSFDSARVKENATEIVEHAFKCFDVDTVDTPEYYDYIESLLNAGLFEKTALEKLMGGIAEHKLIPPNEIKQLLVILLLSSKTSIATLAEAILIKVYELEDPRQNQYITNEISSKLSTSNAEQACRILEVAVQVSLKSIDHLKRMEGIINFCLTNAKFNDDILFQMNQLEILQNLFNEGYGFEYLEGCGALKNFAGQILSPDKALLAPGIMRFFTHAALKNPRKILNEYAPLVELLLTTIRDENNFQETTLETLGQIFLTNESKRILSEKYDALCCETLRSLYSNIPNYPSDIKGRVFECLEKVFTTDDAGNMNNQISYICDRWFRHSQITFTSLLNYCRQPFQDISLTSLRLVSSLIDHAFGRAVLATTGGFVEYLLDRNSISSNDIAIAKYQIVNRLSTATEFDVPSIALFNAYVRNGVYYSDQSATAVYYE